jgi:hypothetical protein
MIAWLSSISPCVLLASGERYREPTTDLARLP